MDRPEDEEEPEGINRPEYTSPSQSLGQVKNSAVSFSGNASTYNYMVLPQPWIPPLMLPPRTQSFVGRDEDLVWLLKQLNDETGKTLALCGPGGIGKTALAAEALTRLIAQQNWVHRFPGGIFYHSFYRSHSLDVAFEELARLFGEESVADPHRAAMRALSRRRTLLVFDGVEVLADSLPLRELGGTHVVLLLSWRQSDAPDLAHRRDLKGLSQNQGITLLQQLAGPRAADSRSVEQLVRSVGGYPLALQLIGSYLSSRQEEVGDYLQWFEHEGLAALNFGNHQAQSVSVLLQRTYNSLDLSEQALFILLGLLAHAPFPVELVQSILELPEREVRQAIGSLVDLSVLCRFDQGYEVSHPLMHAFATERLSSLANDAFSPFTDAITSWRERILTVLTTHFDQSDPYDVIALTLWHPHVLPLLSAKDLTVQQSLRATHLFNAVGSNTLTQGKYTEAEPLLQRALAIREHLLGTMHPATTLSLSNLAALYKNQGKYTEAEPLLQRALAIREQQLGAIHPDTANSLSNLAVLYDHQGKYAEAEPLLQRALTIREQQLGAIHPDTANSLSNLAVLYDHQGKYAEAEPLLQRALTIREHLLGTMHPDTANSLNNLAMIYDHQGKYEEAEPLYERALAICEQQLGAMHPDTASSLNNLAALYKNQGKYTEAEPLYLRALAIYEQQLGAMHPDTASSLNNLAALYSRRGKYEEAEPLLQRALAIREQQLGAMHPDTALSLNNLAALYDHQGKYTEVELMLQQALAIYEQLLGTIHPDTASSLNSLALFYKNEGKYEEAEPLYERALAIREQQLGAMHPDTANSLNNLAALYDHQGKYEEAEPLLQRALAIREQQLGAMHPDTANSLNDLAALYDHQGKYVEAEPLLQRALAIREQQLGITHSDTANSLNNLAALYNHQGKYTEAEPLLQRALAICEQQLGAMHPNTQIVRKNYAFILQMIEQQGETKGLGKSPSSL